MAAEWSSLLLLLVLASIGASELKRYKRSHLGGGFTGPVAGGRNWGGGSTGGGGFPGGSGGGGSPGGNTGGFPSTGGSGGGKYPSGNGGFPGGSGGGGFPGGSTGGGYPSGNTGGGFPGGSGGGNRGGNFGGGNQCQGTGQFVYNPDCTRYIQCDNGKATIMSCQEGMVFNPRFSGCELPGEITCAQAPSGGGNRGVEQSPQCQNPPHAPRNGPYVFNVESAYFCNALHQCTSEGVISEVCTFCGEDEIYDPELRDCVGARGRDMRSICGNKEYVEHRDKAHRRSDPTCNLRDPGRGFPGSNPPRGGNPGTGSNNPWPGTGTGTGSGGNPWTGSGSGSGSGSTAPRGGTGSGCACSSCKC